ncbi:interleukin-17C-like [Polyodon spathula]|uniref:interleukin-17C-like n=1 Tax=Polyodon spathula TaxID=7913 RepID=UPI001B7E2410|nr:interleukin-17C-like [Polyodon spathula]
MSLVAPCCWRHGESKRSHELCMHASEIEDEKMQIIVVGRKVKWNQHHSVNMAEQMQADTRKKRQLSSCEDLQLMSNKLSNDEERSISPWTYTFNVDEDRYPKVLAFAECLCIGCISAVTGKEMTSLNSLLLTQRIMVLRRRPCSSNPDLSAFYVDYINVPVGCTCVRPRTYHF